MRIFSLFSGAGGLDWGFHANGYGLASANDIKTDAAKTYSNNFLVELHEFPVLMRGYYTVWDVSKTQLGYRPREELILLGGPPCQDFSIMRGVDEERKGILSRRGRLYLQFARYLAVLQPAAFVFENVPGILSSNKGADIKAVLEDLQNLPGLLHRWEKQHLADPETPPPPEDLAEAQQRGIAGYSLIYGLVDLATHGVPQRRKRFILIGFREDLPLTEEHKREVAEFLRGDPLLAKFPLTAIEALEGRVLTDLEQEYQEIRREYSFAFGSASILDDYIRASGTPPILKHRLDEALEVHESILRLMGWWGRSLTQLPESAFEDQSHKRASERLSVIERLHHILPGENHEAVRGTRHEVEGRGFSLVYRRLNPVKPSYTVVAHGGGGTWGYHYRRFLSRLTNRERARLQGFPDSFSFWGSQTQMRAQIGEAVPPLFSYRLAKAIGKILAEAGGVFGRASANR